MFSYWCCLGFNQKHTGVTLVLLRDQREKHGVTMVLLRVKRKCIGLTLVLLRVQRKDTGFTLVLLKVKQNKQWFYIGFAQGQTKHMCVTLFCLGSKEKHWCFIGSA